MLKERIFLVIFIMLFATSAMAKEAWKRSFEEEYLKILPVGEPRKRNVCIACHSNETGLKKDSFLME